MKEVFMFNLKPYYTKRIFLFIEGLFYDGTLLYYGGFTRMYELCNAMNAAYNNGFYYGTIENENKNQQ
jgi:hypothetical protein